jgi:NAD(P)-dependent dehydrogenase (short-subunit alcohol dehydrogenase family)
MAKGMRGKVAVVTGGASGIGRVAAQMFAREGVRVAVTTDANVRGAEETVRLIKEAGGEASFIQCDVSKARDVEAMVDKTVEIYGSLDYAFNNAGIGPDGTRVPIVHIVDMPEELWDRHIAINLTGVFLCMKYEMRQMIKQKHGSIVNTSSVGALKAVPGFSAYDATKTGLFGLTKAAALEGATLGVRVNVICPGPTGRTLLMDNLTASQPAVRDKFREVIPMQRVAEPEEMAEAVIWFCSDAASFVTGQILAVDGGMTAM